jgi:triosephosphate isomerase
MSDRNRRPFVAGNWKLHNTVTESVTLVRTLRERLQNPPCEVAVAPVFTALDAVGRELRGSALGLAAQNVHWEPQGAFTGEVSPPLLQEVGCQYCIVGHSERRQLFGETNDGVRRKVQALLGQGLRPIACIGESLEQREANRTLEVVLDQLDAAFHDLSAEQAREMVVAYEPVWAIGTGRTASPGDAQEVHAAIRGRLRERHGGQVADAVRLLYGGSVKPDNAEKLMGQVDIDGALVGGASLKPDSFVAIAEAAG